MEPGGSVPHSQGLSNNPNPNPNQPISLYSYTFFKIIPTSLRFILILYSHLLLGLPKDLFPVGVPVMILKALLPSYLATWPSHLNVLDLITLTKLGARYRLWSLRKHTFTNVNRIYVVIDLKLFLYNFRNWEDILQSSEAGASKLYFSSGLSHKAELSQEDISSYIKPHTNILVVYFALSLIIKNTHLFTLQNTLFHWFYSLKQL